MEDHTMNKQAIQHIIKGHYKKIKKQLNNISAGFNPKDIHQFRVTYKKLRAFLRMLSLQNEIADKIRILKKIKHCYHLSGLLRDLQLQQQHITETSKQELKKPGEYLKLLQGEMNTVKKHLSEIIATNPVTAGKRNTSKHIPGNFPLKNFRLYAKEKWHDVHNIVAASRFTEQTLHNIRKKLKDLFYNLKKMEPAKNKKLSTFIHAKLNEHYFNKLMGELGNFQDKCAGVVLLKPVWLNKLNKYNQQQLAQIKKQWIKDKVLMKHLLITNLKTHFKIQTAPQQQVNRGK
jgi:CHAD domain-containing protein